MTHLLAGQLLGKKYGLQRKQSYVDKIIATAPIAYWPLDELSGTIAINYGTLGAAANGVYNGVVLANTPAPGGGLAPLWDGTNDFCDIYSAALAAAFSGAVGSAVIWSKVLSASVWADGATRVMFRAFINASNYVVMQKLIAANTTRHIYNAAATPELYDLVETPTDWVMRAITWSKPAEEVKYYKNNTLLETDTALGVFTGSLQADTTLLGCQSVSAPATVWSGWLAHAMIYDRVLTLPQITNSLYLPAL